GRNVLELLAKRLCGAVDRYAPDGNRARTTGAGTAFDAVGVALHNAHAIRRQAEPLCDELRVGRRMPLPGRLRADQQCDTAIAVERERRRLGTVVATSFHIGGDADAAQVPGAPRL